MQPWFLLAKSGTKTQIHTVLRIEELRVQLAKVLTKLSETIKILILKLDDVNVPEAPQALQECCGSNIHMTHKHYLETKRHAHIPSS
jgi:hypothetical protein